MALLEVNSLSKSYTAGQFAVDSVSLSVEQNAIVCLLGPSGCGKTSLLRSIAGLELPDAGEVWFDGQDMVHVPPYQRDFGMMFQDFALFPHKNVAENIAFGLQMQGQSQEEIERRVREMLQLVALPGFAERDVAQLSGGEQQRVALARSLAPEPRLLMLDEPLGALDRALRERLMLDLRRILKDVSVTAIYVTHDQTEAFAVADRVALMNAGRIEQVDTPQTVYYQPATQFAARFLGFRNLLPAVVADKQTVRTAIGELAVVETNAAPGSRVTLLIRPEAAAITEAGQTVGQSQIEAVVMQVSFRGKYSQVWFAAAGETLLFEMSDNALVVGETVTLSIDPRATNLLPG